MPSVAPPATTAALSCLACGPDAVGCTFPLHLPSAPARLADYTASDWIRYYEWIADHLTVQAMDSRPTPEQVATWRALADDYLREATRLRSVGSAS